MPICIGKISLRLKFITLVLFLQEKLRKTSVADILKPLLLFMVCFKCKQHSKRLHKTELFQL